MKLGSHAIELSALGSIVAGLVVAALLGSRARGGENLSHEQAQIGRVIAVAFVGLMLALLALTPDLPVFSGVSSVSFSATAMTTSGAASSTSATAIKPSPLHSGSGCVFSVAGSQYRSLGSSNTGPVTDDPYYAVWTDGGMLWQPKIASLGERTGFSILAEIPAGNYAFTGVSATVYRDDGKALVPNGLVILAGGGNGMPFTVAVGNDPTAWILVVGDGGASAGFAIQRVGALC
jgi:hypothetical protein